MSKAVLISIRPEWVELILSGKKTAEVRKTYPKAPDLPYPFKCYIYRTKMPDKMIDIIKDGNVLDWYLQEGEEPTIYHGKPTFIKVPGEKGAVVAEFTCDCVESLWRWGWSTDPWETVIGQPMKGCTCMELKQIEDYANGDGVFSWHITDLKRYDKPLALSTFGLKRPPQSWGYVEELQE